MRPLLILLLVLAATSPAEQRIWTDLSGRTLKATPLTADDEHAYLRTSAGKEATVIIGTLSHRDLEYLRKWKGLRRKDGILHELPLVWDHYRARNLRPGDALERGYYEIDSGEEKGILELEFKRLGKLPAKPLVLRLTIARHHEAGTMSKISALYRGKVVGSVLKAKAGETVDLPLPASILKTDDTIELTIKGGRDPVFIRHRESGHGPRLVFLQKKP